MDKFRWGILATGNIAGSMAEALQCIEDAELLAVASRSKASADAFGERWDVPRRYSDYESLAADPDVDVIYIATPHSFHAQNIRTCLEAGKHVLCEKPLTLNARESAECISLARQKGLFLMEAVWMRFFPAMAKLRDWIDNGVIGPVRLLQADFCFQLPFDPDNRLYNLELGGGALLDVGIYPLTFTTMLMGFPNDITGRATVGSTGVDEVSSLILNYEGQTLAQLTGSMSIYKPQEAFVVGPDGYIKIHEPFYCPRDVTLKVGDSEPEVHEFPYIGNGYPHEVMEVHQCLRAGKTESELMPLDQTQKMMELMDQMRSRWKIVYPCDTV